MFGISLETLSTVLFIFATLIGVGYNYILTPLWNTHKEIIKSIHEIKEQVAVLAQLYKVEKDDSKEYRVNNTNEIRFLRDELTKLFEDLTALESKRS